MKAYADTGLIVSLYKSEITSGEAREAIRDVTGGILITPLVELEFRNAMQLAVFRKEIPAEHAVTKLDLFLGDLKGGVFALSAIPSSELYTAASRLSDKHTASIGTRSLDLMHVAAAMILGADTFLSSDSRQREAAKREGLTVLP